MKINLKSNQKNLTFDNASQISIGSASDCDFRVENISEGIKVILKYSEQHGSYIILNPDKNENVKCGGKTFTKALVPTKFTLNIENQPINIQLDNTQQEEVEDLTQNVLNSQEFDSEIEKQRVAIIKDIGGKLTQLKATLRTYGMVNVLFNAAIVILSVFCAFGTTNFLLGLKVTENSQTLNLTTNFGALVFISIIIATVNVVIKLCFSAKLLSKKGNGRRESFFAQSALIFCGCIFMFIVYCINLNYWKGVNSAGALFISLLFALSLTAASFGGGYFKFKATVAQDDLINCEYRPDLEMVIKKYRYYIERFVNNLSQNKLNNVRASILNHQLMAVLEIMLGIVTAPVLAYGVSNTLAMCFPEAASWVRVSGLRFSPVFLILATFMIIFAFFSFVKAFSIGKQIQCSEIIKLDGFSNWEHHGVTIYGLDAIRSLNREKMVLLSIAISIVIIEITMNLSYFISTQGSDLQGMFVSLMCALIPTALLIVETLLLNYTSNEINNCSKLLSLLD